MRHNKTMTIGLMLLLVGSLAPGLAPAAATNHCDLEVPADYSTIQQALNNAGTGDTVCVAAGTFVEAPILPNVDDLTLIGAGKGATIIDADGQSSRGINAEFSPSDWNEGLRLEGFTITGSSQYGLKVAWAEDVQVVDVEAVDNYRTGIDLNIVSDVTLNGVEATDNGGNGIAVRNADDVVVVQASVSGNAWGGLAFYAPNAETVSDVLVVDSHFFGPGKGIYFQYDGYSDIRIEGNLFEGTDLGVIVEDHPTFGTPDAGGISLAHNAFSGNAVAAANTGTGTLDAIGNHWGSPTGPTHPDNPLPLTGDAVEGNVEFTLWCMVESCLV